MTGQQGESRAAHAFLACAAEVARVLGVEAAEEEPGTTTARKARILAGALRRPLMAVPVLPEEMFRPLMAAAVHDPDPSFCRWFVEPALYGFGRRRVFEALVEYLRSGADAERLGAMRAWYCAHLDLSADRSPAYAPGGVRPAELDAAGEAAGAWVEVAMGVFLESGDLRVRHRLLEELPRSREDCPARLSDRFEAVLDAARADHDEHLRSWARRVERAPLGGGPNVRVP